jgi:hypothetical protein
MTTTPDAISRSTFLRRSAGLLAMTVFDVRHLSGVLLDGRNGLQHPDPRPGITAEHVLADDALGGEMDKDVLEAYASARTYPEIFDGLACGCGCAGESGGHRSLLSCYESLQPAGCHPCRTEAQLVAKMAKKKKSLAEIRKEVDKRYSPE